MSHAHHIEDSNGELADIVRLCSDTCHRDWCRENDTPYEGWSGCHELESTDYCASCGVVLPGFSDACECQTDNIVVNRFLSEHGEKCEHGNWLQVPEANIR